MKYDPRQDYCGPGESWLTRLIPKKIAGVDINHCCYIHDAGWSGREPRYKSQDIAFRKCIMAKFFEKARTEKSKVKRTALRALGFVVAWVYYASVRIGSLGRRV